MTGKRQSRRRYLGCGMWKPRCVSDAELNRLSGDRYGHIDNERSFGLCLAVDARRETCTLKFREFPLEPIWELVEPGSQLATRSSQISFRDRRQVVWVDLADGQVAPGV